jgi:hypothetical protein
MNPIWKVYKSKVLKTLNPDLEEYTEEEVENIKSVSFICRCLIAVASHGDRSVGLLIHCC